MIDRYTKLLLTVIAVSLATIAVRGPIAGQAVAQPFGSDCGGTEFRPCHIRISHPATKFLPGAGDVRVEITNWPLR
jgi:hypothetical protein